MLNICNLLRLLFFAQNNKNQINIQQNNKIFYFYKYHYPRKKRINQIHQNK
jgi:hypothetical protein